MGYEKSQYAPSCGTVTYSFLLVWFQPDSNELGQSGSVIIEHAKCPVPSPGHGAGFLNHVTEEYWQLQIPLNEQGRLENPAEFDGVLNGVIGHKTLGYKVYRLSHCEICVTERAEGPSRIGTFRAIEMGRWLDESVPPRRP